MLSCTKLTNLSSLFAFPTQHQRTVGETLERAIALQTHVIEAEADGLSSHPLLQFVLALTPPRPRPSLAAEKALFRSNDNNVSKVERAPHLVGWNRVKQIAKFC